MQSDKASELSSDKASGLFGPAPGAQLLQHPASLRMLLSKTGNAVFAAQDTELRAENYYMLAKLDERMRAKSQQYTAALACIVCIAALYLFHVLPTTAYAALAVAILNPGVSALLYYRHNQRLVRLEARYMLGEFGA